MKIAKTTKKKSKFHVITASQIKIIFILYFSKKSNSIHIKMITNNNKNKYLRLLINK